MDIMIVISSGMTGETGAASVGKRATQTEAASCTRGLTLLLIVQFRQGSFAISGRV